MRIHIGLKQPARAIVAEVDATDLDDVADAVVHQPYLKVRQILEDGTEASAILRSHDVQTVTQIDFTSTN
jgi:hypothetical protein